MSQDDTGERNWIVYQFGHYYGPFSLSDVARLVRSGRIKPHSWVSRQGSTEQMIVQHVIEGVPLPEADPLQEAADAEQWALAAKAGSHRIDYRRVLKDSRRVLERSGFFLGRYRRWCGLRSFIFQMICLGWTALWLCRLMYLLSLAGYFDPAAESLAAQIITNLAWYYCGGFWALVALPTGIAAIATLEANKQ
jgi:hypothetical protein